MGTDYDAKMMVGYEIDQDAIDVDEVIKTIPPKYESKTSPTRKRTKTATDESETDSDDESDYREYFKNVHGFNGKLNNWLTEHFPKFEIAVVSNCQTEETDYYLSYKMDPWHFSQGVKWSKVLDYFDNVDVDEFMHVYKCVTGEDKVKPMLYTQANVS